MTSPWLFMQIFEVLSNAPLYHVALEGSLFLGVLWLIFHKSSNAKSKAIRQLTTEEKEKLIDEWTPEPLVQDVPRDHLALKPRIVSGKAGLYIDVDGKHCLNVATHNYLNFIGNEEIEEKAIQTVQKYGVGSCGPRGFYGTVDVHLELEERLAQFMQMEEAAVYSYNFSTIASAIPAYAKRGDVIFVDENVNFAIQKGLDASRSKICYFKHNDMEYLEKLLILQNDFDRKNPKRALVTRRFLVVEGIYMNSGDICPLPRLIELRKKYKLRIFLDENISFGTLGENGRGVTEYFNIPKEDVDLIVGSMEWAMGTIGGFCAGSSFIVEHQRLSGLGYCFSASLPPLLATAAITALDLMERNKDMFMELKKKCHMVHVSLFNLKSLTVQGHLDSPVKHLYLTEGLPSVVAETTILNEIVNHCAENGVALVVASYLDAERFDRRPSIRIAVNRAITPEDILKLTMALLQACNEDLELEATGQ